MIRFVRLYALLTISLLACVAGFCIVIDPYYVFGTLPIPGISRDKPQAAVWPHLAKTHQIMRQSGITTLLIGSSTTEIGFDPHSKSFDPGDKVYNFGIDGLELPAQLPFLREALLYTHPKRIIIATSFIENLIAPMGDLPVAHAASDPNLDRLHFLNSGGINPAREKAQIADLAFAALSLNALTDSLYTVLHQNDPNTPSCDSAGFNLGGLLNRWTRQDGTATLVTAKDRDKASKFINWRKNPLLPTEVLTQLVEVARAHGAEVVMVILPVHVDLQEMLHQTGLDTYDDHWKQAIKDSLSTHHLENNVKIWDFSGISPYTTENLPPVGDHHTHWQWFWESQHFQKALGDIMLARINHLPAPADFGVEKLTPGNPGLPAWELTHAQDVARIKAIIAAAN